MNPEENTNAVVLNGQQKKLHPPVGEQVKVRKHYFHQHLLMNQDANAVLPDDDWLLTLNRRTVRLAEMLSLLERSHVEEIPVLQKACFSNFVENILSRKERQRIIEAWTSWSDFLLSLNCYRDSASLFLKYYQHALQEIENLLSTAESSTINQEGGM